MPIALIRRHAGSLRSPPGTLSAAHIQSVLIIEEQARLLDRLLVSLEGVDRAGPVERRSAPVSGASAPSPPAVLVADDDDDVLEALTDLLSDRYRLTLARDGGEAMAALRSCAFDLAIFDVSMPVVHGFELLKAMRASDELQSSAVMFLSVHSDPQLKVQALALGAVDYMTKPFDPDELLARVARIVAAVTREASLRADAMTDPLTGLANYRSFSLSLERELERSRRYALPLSLLTVDLDHLKAINDGHGHDAGSEAIRVVARVLSGAVRKFEVVARHGGDEFAVILPSTGAADAEQLAERLRGEIGAQVVHGVRLSASIGVASWNEASRDAAALIKASDAALYRAKRAGRDRIEIASRQDDTIQ